MNAIGVAFIIILSGWLSLLTTHEFIRVFESKKGHKPFEKDLGSGWEIFYISCLVLFGAFYVIIVMWIFNLFI